MRKFISALVLLLIATPVLASVTVSLECDETDANVVYLKYVASGEPNKIRAFALDIQVSGANTIDEVNVADYNDYYYVYPGAINIKSDGTVQDWGSPVADSAYPGTLDGLGTSGVTLEMGSLYDACDPDHNTPPPDSNMLAKLVSSAPTAWTIVGNTTRADANGVVMEDPCDIPAVTLSGTNCAEAPKCFPSGHDDYQTWLDVGEPNCWCFTRQCHGDAEGTKEGKPATGFWYVGSKDLSVLVTAWKKKEPPKGSGAAAYWAEGVSGICADFAHDKEGKPATGFWRVGSSDLTILTTYWKKKEPPKGSGVPADCPD